ncbi:ankyrin repeat domain-containing protein [Armatimonas sp.]|uniref:ankyrin repeat domain-containing protein n=1 Tax=Armatimonas sp. TaxID=1872638 RepID=UPI00375340DE
MSPTYTQPGNIYLWPLTIAAGIAFAAGMFATVPLALIRVIYLLSIFALPLALVIRICFKRLAGLALGLILFAPFGFVGTMIWESGDEMCHKAARNGSVEWLRTVLTGGPDVVDTHGNSLLMKAAQYGHTGMVRELLKRGARTNYRDGDGDTALTSAERHGHAECARLLRAAGAHR